MLVLGGEEDLAGALVADEARGLLPIIQLNMKLWQQALAVTGELQGLEEEAAGGGGFLGSGGPYCCSYHGLLCLAGLYLQARLIEHETLIVAQHESILKEVELDTIGILFGDLDGAVDALDGGGVTLELSPSELEDAIRAHFQPEEFGGVDNHLVRFFVPGVGEEDVYEDIRFDLAAQEAEGVLVVYVLFPQFKCKSHKELRIATHLQYCVLQTHFSNVLPLFYLSLEFNVRYRGAFHHRFLHCFFENYHCFYQLLEISVVLVGEQLLG